MGDKREFAQRSSFLESQLEELRERERVAGATIASLTSRLEAAETTIDAERSARLTIQSAASEATTSLDSLLAKNASLERERNRLESDVSTLTATLSRSEVCGRFLLSCLAVCRR